MGLKRCPEQEDCTIDPRRDQGMWLFTTIGFYSVVQKSEDTELTVRARVRADLDRLREKYLPELTPTETGTGTDYPHRGRVSHEAFGRALARLAQDIDYSNFKNTIYAEQGAERAHIYGAVWHAVVGLETEDAG
jgi:hypothetical protein